MKKFCSKCGTEIGDAKFCPNCGAEANYGTAAYHASKSLEIGRYIPMVFPVLYVILILFKWFRLSIPLLGEREFGIYNLYGGLDDLFSYTDGGGAEFTAKAFAVVLLILAVVIAYLSIKACVRIIKGSEDIAACISSASIASVVEAILVIVAVMILKAVIKIEFSDSGLGYFGTELGQAASDMIDFTGVPIVLFIAGIIGKIVSNKLIYTKWKNKLKDNDILSRIQGDGEQ